MSTCPSCLPCAGYAVGCFFSFFMPIKSLGPPPTQESIYVVLAAVLQAAQSAAVVLPLCMSHLLCPLSLQGSRALALLFSFLSGRNLWLCSTFSGLPSVYKSCKCSSAHFVE